MRQVSGLLPAVHCAGRIGLRHLGQLGASTLEVLLGLALGFDDRVDALATCIPCGGNDLLELCMGSLELRRQAGCFVASMASVLSRDDVLALPVVLRLNEVIRSAAAWPICRRSGHGDAAAPQQPKRPKRIATAVGARIRMAAPWGDCQGNAAAA